MATFLGEFFLELQKKFFFLTPCPLLVAGPLKKELLFSGFPNEQGFSTKLDYLHHRCNQMPRRNHRIYIPFLYKNILSIAQEVSRISYIEGNRIFKDLYDLLIDYSFNFLQFLF